MRNTILIVGCAIALSGCATKQYPIALELTPYEAQGFSCDQLDLELARAYQARGQVANIANPDWRSAAGFLGDFGIGNAMARSAADKALSKRTADLHGAKIAKNCPGGSIPASTPSS